jgi:prepilin-type N-terminal cleavage/methylation domain-containing protein
MIKNIGFTLIEVIVALAIIASAYTVLIELQGSSMTQLFKASNNNKKILIEKQIQESLVDKNFSIKSSGNGRILDAAYQWDAKKITQYKLVRSPEQDIPSDFQVALFQIKIQISYDNGEQWHSIIQQLSWKNRTTR